jgi:hypothetical protein
MLCSAKEDSFERKLEPIGGPDGLPRASKEAIQVDTDDVRELPIGIEPGLDV